MDKVKRTTHIFFSLVLLAGFVAWKPLSAEIILTSDNDKLILVSGVTGRQGGAVARELLKSGYRVRGLTRNPAGERARIMQDLGVEIVRGDFDDIATLDNALGDVYGVFSVQNFWEHGYEGEVRQGKNFADAARRAGIKHFIYTSVANADRNTSIPHFESKLEIEKHIQSIGLPYTILAPVSFMENLEYSRREILDGKLVSPFSKQTRLQQISVSDIGRFAVNALDKPERWLGRRLDIAGDQYSLGQLLDMLSKITGREIQHIQVPWDEYEKNEGPEMTIMDKWIDSIGYQADITGLKKEIPDLLGIEEYLYGAGWGD